MEIAFKILNSHHLQVVVKNIKTIGFSRKLKHKYSAKAYIFAISQPPHQCGGYSKLVYKHPQA